MTLLRDNLELLSAFRGGEEAALTRVYQEYVDIVAGVVRSGVSLSGGGHVGGVPRDTWSDLVQETFVRAFGERARTGYDGQRPYRPYLLTICRNLVCDWARQRGREIPTEALEEIESGSTPPGSPTGTPPPLPGTAVDPWDDPATLAVVQTYVAALKPPLSEVYQVRYVQGVSQAQAAQTLALTRQRIRTIEAKLRVGLEKALRRAESARRAASRTRPRLFG